ncbi:MAG: hypothetical protein AAFY84_14450 [Pseudomonadota bacterium]
MPRVPYLFAALVAVAVLIIPASAAQQSNPPRDTAKQEKISPMKATLATRDLAPKGDPDIEACLKEKLGTEKLCTDTEDQARRACVEKAWNMCQKNERMKINPVRNPLKKKPARLNSKRPDGSINCKEGEADCQEQTDAAQMTPINTRITTGTETRNKCSACSGTCQTVAWLSGHSSYEGVDIGGGQSPSQCIDAVKKLCESGASRFLAGATCKQ